MGLTIALASVLVVPVVSAQDDPHERVVDLSTRSHALYRDGRYSESIALLREAYALEADPTLLYNVARAYEALFHSLDATDPEATHALDAALEAYASYLATAPEDRAVVEGRVEDLRRERPSAPSTAVVSPAPALAPGAPAIDRTWAVVVTTLGAVALAGGGVLFGVSAERHERALAADTPHVDALAADAVSRDLLAGAIVTSSLALGVLVTGLVGLVVPADEVDVRVDSAGALVSWRGRF